jgi:signal transduction histidine kinase
LQKQAPSSLDDKSRRYIQTILDSAKRMGNLIDDLLAFSRLGRAAARLACSNRRCSSSRSLFSFMATLPLQ